MEGEGVANAAADLTVGLRWCVGGRLGERYRLCPLGWYGVLRRTLVFQGELVEKGCAGENCGVDHG